MLKWPERKQLIETTPLSFCGLFKTKVAVIVDCFEVYIQHPTNLKSLSPDMALIQTPQHC